MVVNSTNAEGNLKLKISKVLILLLKYIPFITALAYALNSITSCLGVDMLILGNLFHLSAISLIFIYVASSVFKFCIYHRMFLHYILVNNVLSAIDFYFNLNIPNKMYLVISMVLICLTLFLVLYFYLKSKK